MCTKRRCIYKKKHNESKRVQKLGYSKNGLKLTKNKQLQPEDLTGHPSCGGSGLLSPADRVISWHVTCRRNDRGERERETNTRGPRAITVVNL